MSSNVLYGIFFMRHIVLLAMLSYEVSFFVGHVGIWGMLFYGSCRLMGNLVL